MLGVMRAAILTIPFKRLTTALKHEQNRTDIDPLSQENSQMAHLIGKSIRKAAKYTP